MKRIISFLLFLTLCFSVSCSKNNHNDGWEPVGNSSPNSQKVEAKVEITQQDGKYTYNLVPASDDSIALKNPDKGWYIHYYDNSITRYGTGLKAKDAVKMIPCLDHIYLRLAWSYLEPKDDEYSWDVIDKVIDDFAAQGVKVSFRITCKETDSNNKYATPKWVQNAGAKGTMMDNAWEPDYGDPIFLEKLEDFHKAFAERYDSREDVIYVDVGSYGDWGEGHTASSSKKDWSWETIKAHFDIYKNHYKNTQIVISDDFIGSRSTKEGKDEILNYVLENGWTFRDDSIAVEWFAKTYGDKLRSPKLFEAVMDSKPTIVELEHYHHAKNANTWKAGKPLLSAMDQMNATYGGFHGYPADFIKDNPQFAIEAGNKLGYWYFIDNITLFSDDSNINIEIKWQNKGVSKAYNKYDFNIILTDSENNEKVYAQTDFDNTKILPDNEFLSNHTISKAGLTSGKYTLKIAMNKGDEKVYIAIADKFMEQDGVYTIGDFEI